MYKTPWWMDSICSFKPDRWLYELSQCLQWKKSLLPSWTRKTCAWSLYAWWNLLEQCWHLCFKTFTVWKFLMWILMSFSRGNVLSHPGIVQGNSIPEWTNLWNSSCFSVLQLKSQWGQWKFFSKCDSACFLSFEAWWVA